MGDLNLTNCKSNGFNPMNWNCDKRGCFNKLKRPKIEVFHTNFPGKINFGDVDGIVEIAGNALMLEWKDINVPVTQGQYIMYERITKYGPITVMVVAGNAETMDIYQYAYFHNGKYYDWTAADLNDVNEKIKKWVAYAYKNDKTKNNNKKDT